MPYLNGDPEDKEDEPTPAGGNDIPPRDKD